MDQNLENYDLLSKINVKITAPVTATKTAQGKRSQKCIQCEYASSCASDLRRHLKIHSGEKKLRSATSVNMPVLIQAA